MIKLSIIIPIYNVERYIERCLKSIFNNSFQEDEIEIVLVDDESKDNSINIARFLVEKYKNVKIIQQKNRGLGGARNTGLRNSTGQYIWFIDSDDKIPLNAIDVVLKSIKSENDIYIFDAIHLPLKYPTKPKFFFVGFENLLGCLVSNHFVINQVWRCVYNRKFILQNELFFKEKFLHEDGEFNLRATTFAKTVTYSAFDIYYYYTNNSNSIMNTIGIKNQMDLLNYFNTADSIELTSDLSTCQKTNLNKHKLNMIGVLLRNSIDLTAEDFNAFTLYFHKYKSKVFQILRSGTIKEMLKVYLMMHLTSQLFNRLVFLKKLK